MAFTLPSIDPALVDSFVATLTPAQRDVVFVLACEPGPVPVVTLSYRDLAIAQGLAAADMGLLTLVVLDHATSIALTPLGHEIVQVLAEGEASRL
jgi:hypothetical protein